VICFSFLDATKYLSRKHQAYSSYGDFSNSHSRRVNVTQVGGFRGGLSRGMCRIVNYESTFSTKSAIHTRTIERETRRYLVRADAPSRGAIRSPNFSTRLTTSPAAKRIKRGLALFAHLVTSAQVTGVETVGSSRALSE
jgi:hypothetical protein